MPSHDKLKDLEKELNRFGLNEEAEDVRSLKMRMTPIEMAVMFGGLNGDIALADLEDDESEEDCADDNDIFDYSHFGLGGDSKHDRKAAGEAAKEQYRRHVGGLRYKARFELDSLLEEIGVCKTEGDPYGELKELYAKLPIAQKLFKKYDAEYFKLSKPKKIRQEQTDDASDQKFYSVPTNYKYEIGQEVIVYETPHDTFPAVISGHRMDVKNNLKMYRVIKTDGTKVWCPEFRIEPLD